MQSYRLLFLLTLGLVSQLQAQSLLWKVSGNNLKEPAWLYGTMHVQDPRVFNLPEGWEQKLKSAGRLALEIDLSIPPDPVTLMTAMTAPQDSSLDKLISAEDYTILNQWFTDSMSMSLDMFRKMKPFMLISLIQKSRMDSDMPVALDMWLADKAKIMGIPVQGIETLEEQLTILNHLSLSEQARMLTEMIQKPNEHTAQENEMMEAYLNGQLDKLLIMANNWETDPIFKSEIINRRNKIMASRLMDILKTGSVFAAIGALHLPGEEGVIQLLKNEGYEVMPE